MSRVTLSNIPENWVYDTSEYKPWELKKLFAAFPAEIEELGTYEILVIPHKGQEKAMRIICNRLFMRTKGSSAREILAKHKAAK